MKRYFFTGLFLLLPFALTVLIVQFAVNVLTTPFEDIMKAILSHYHLFDGSFLFFSRDQILTISSKLLVLITLFAVIILVGFLGQLFLFASIMKLGETLIHHIPFVNAVYKGIKSVTKTFFNSPANTFSQVALVRFPCSEAYSIGLISQTDPSNTSSVINVFIPTTPNPTIGYIVSFQRSELIFIDMKVDSAIKCIVSCGVMFPELHMNPTTTSDQPL